MGKNAFHVFLFTTYKMSSLTKIEKIYEYLGKLLEEQEKLEKINEKVEKFKIIEKTNIKEKESKIIHQTKPLEELKTN